MNSKTDRGIDVNSYIYVEQEKSAQASDGQIKNIEGSEQAYNDALVKLQHILSTKHATELATLLNDSNDSTMKNHIKDIIASYILSTKIVVPGYNHNELVDSIFEDMAGLGFLKKYIYDELNPELEDGECVEEINANAYDDIEIVTNKRTYKAPEKFYSTKDAVKMAKKLCYLGNQILDESTPTVDSDFMKGVRISGIMTPVVDKDVGVAFSIRKQKDIVPSKQQYIKWGAALEEELDLITFSVSTGISVAIVGSTGAGKTTYINFVLNNLGDDLRIITIEDIRELNCIKRDDDGNVLNRVLHLKTRPDDQFKRNVDEKVLLKRILRLHPNVIVPAEIRGEEALTAVDAAITGHTVVTGFHAEGGEDAYVRIFTMCKKSGIDLADQLLMNQILMAFPIIVFTKQLKDNSRKIMSIIEGEKYVDNRVKFRTLYKYQIHENILTDDGLKVKEVVGKHIPIKKISNKLANRLLENGATTKRIKKFAAEDWDPTKLEEGEDY